MVDNDPFSVNQFAHPYQGSLYHSAGRSTGLNYWEAAALTFAGSAWWEITGEQTPPSRNDQVASGIAGTFLGEALFRMAQLALRDGSSVPQAYREWVAAIISPSVGLNRLAFGSRFDSVYADHDPAYYGRVHLGYTHVAQRPFDTAASFKPDMAQADFAIDYGLPGKPGYTYRRPFDYFRLQVLFSSANGIENLSTRGLLYGTDYALGDDYRGIWGLYGHYDYIAPQLFQVSTTALSLGTTGQWWASKSIALQGSALLGLGYAATSTTGATDVKDGNYHYGASTPAALMLRAVAGDRAAIDVSGRFISLGHMTRRADGRDEISRIDSAFTWRVHGQHAVGVNYLWSHRSASYPGGQHPPPDPGDDRRVLHGIEPAGLWRRRLAPDRRPLRASGLRSNECHVDRQRDEHTQTQGGQDIGRPVHADDQSRQPHQAGPEQCQHQRRDSAAGPDLHRTQHCGGGKAGSGQRVAARKARAPVGRRIPQRRPRAADEGLEQIGQQRGREHRGSEQECLGAVPCDLQAGCDDDGGCQQERGRGGQGGHSEEAVQD